MGNLRSVEKALALLGEPTRIAPDVDGADRLIIPGVGAFGAAMERLDPLRDQVQAFASAGKPILGICLGQQLLFERSEEFGDHAGLGLLSGTVRYLPAHSGLKIPLIGWCSVRQTDPLATEEISPEAQFYFVHSLYCQAEPADVSMTAEHGITFPAAVRRGRIWGAQFHPEKSGRAGLTYLRNFLRC